MNESRSHLNENDFEDWDYKERLKRIEIHYLYQQSGPCRLKMWKYRIQIQDFEHESLQFSIEL